ncbi:hypothetical protein [Lactococcus lactis]|uniref:hypothetical protein n=1 Tax=Lactococcus lactis TaxID=1358 RepID=UPI000493E41C|nr:hypothetical protein [Lactococcus lactis]
MDKDTPTFDKENYIKEFLNLNSNKFSKEQSINIFLGALFQLLTDKTVFNKNSDIKIFLNQIFEKEYKDYLFRSRPYLAARVLKDIKKYRSYRDIINLSTEIAKILDKEILLDSKTSKTKPKNKIENNILGWLDHVNKDGEK